MALVLEYDGTDLAGFQVQRSRPTVQGELEGAIAAIVGAPVRIAGAGRTDAGVHAVGQVATFTTESQLTPDQWVRALNAHLPPSIAVRRALEAPMGFHARYSAASREYRYTILNRPSRAPIGRAYRWHVPRPLDEAAMARALRRLVGRHDFAAFAGVTADGVRRGGTVRTLLACSCRRKGEEVLIEMAADAFLPHMVRNVVGTVVPVGRGDLADEAIVEILASRDRSRAGATAPPHGLCLVRVNYGDLSI